MSKMEHRLARLLETRSLTRVVPHLPPETLHQLVRDCGLDACGELVTSATPAQLASLLDLDLWHQERAGTDHRFDVDRFGDWLEVLVDAGDSVAARTIAALDKGLVIAGLSGYVRVFDAGIFEPTAQSDDEPTERREAMREGDSMPVAPTHGASGLDCEIGGYVVRARRSDAWDAIVALLVALDSEHADCFHAVMQGCRKLSNSNPEIDDLHDLLSAPDQHLHDVAIERERRRSRQGYATPAEARAFLEMTRHKTHRRSEASAAATSVNPIIAAYFRAADEGWGSSTTGSASTSSSYNAPHSSDVSESFETVMELLTESGVMPDRPRALLDAIDAGHETGSLAVLRRLMGCLRDAHEPTYFTRTRELAFLANALLAGCSVQSRPFSPVEASDAAAAVCNLGLEYCAEAHADGVFTDTPFDSFLIDHDLVTAFEVGWSVLHHDVGLYAAQELILILDDLRCIDRDIHRGLMALRRALTRHRAARTPWLARDAAEVLAMLDATAWISVLGLLDECPVLPAALTAVLEGRTTTVSATAFDFISTTAQIAEVRAFMLKLSSVLSG